VRGPRTPDAQSNQQKNRYRGKQFAEEISFQKRVDQFWVAIVDGRERIAHLLCPYCHHQKSEWGIIEAVIFLVRFLLHSIIQPEIPAAESGPRIRGSLVGRQSPRFFDDFATPVKAIYEVSLETHMPRGLADPAA
jgi:hypothetical protein